MSVCLSVCVLDLVLVGGGGVFQEISLCAHRETLKLLKNENLKRYQKSKLVLRN